MQVKIPTVAYAPKSLAFKLLIVSSFISEGLAPPQCLNTHFSSPHGRPDSALHVLQPDGLSEGLIKYLLVS
jgi:hypothetical protein